MKSTIQLSGERKAVVDIPYSKLIPSNDNPKQSHACCQSKIVVTGGNSNRSSSKIDIKRMVEEMEQAYDRDVKALQTKIKQLQDDRERSATHWQRERRQLQAEWNIRKAGFEKEIDILRQDSKKKDTEIRKIQQQRQILLRNKISEFKQVEYIDRLNELTHILRLKDCQIKELAAKYELVNTERVNMEQHSRNSQLKLEQQISRLSLQLSNTTNSLINQQNNISYASKLKEDQTNKLINQLKYHLQKAELSLKQAHLANEAKDKQINNLNHTINNLEKNVNSLERNVTELESQITQLKDGISDLTTVKHQLQEEVGVCRRTIGFLSQEKERLLLELDVRFREIDRLKLDLFEKEKVYQVKIQRVIDSKQQIQQLQSTIFQQQQQITKLAQEKQYLAEDIAKLKAELQSQAELRVKIQGQISGLKAYISKRQGSFRWAVQRQIEKDILVSDERPQSYKVSQVGEYSRIKNDQTHINKVISQQIGLQMQANLFGNFPPQIILQKFRQ